MANKAIQRASGENQNRGMKKKMDKKLMNEDQIIALVKETSDEVSARYDNKALRFFLETAKHLTAYLELCGNEQVVDVATGTGNAALAIASALPTGRVTALDFSAGMLDGW